MRTQIRTSCFAGGGGGVVRGRGSGPEIQARKEGSGTEKRRKCRNMTERETLSAQRDFYWTRTEQRSSQLSVAVSHVLMLPWQLPLSKVRLPTTKLEAKKKCVPHRVLHVGFIHRSSAVSSSGPNRSGVTTDNGSKHRANERLFHEENHFPGRE